MLYARKCGDTAIPPYCPNPCTFGERGRIRGVAFVDKDVTINDPSDPAEWKTKIENGDVILIPTVRGEYDGGSANEVDGYGAQETTVVGREHVVTYYHKDVVENVDFYNGLNYSTQYVLWFVTENWVWDTGQPGQVKAGSAIDASTNTRMEWEVEVSWTNPNNPIPYAKPGNVFTTAYTTNSDGTSDCKELSYPSPSEPSESDGFLTAIQHLAVQIDADRIDTDSASQTIVTSLNCGNGLNADITDTNAPNDLNLAASVTGLNATNGEFQLFVQAFNDGSVGAGDYYAEVTITNSCGNSVKLNVPIIIKPLDSAFYVNQYEFATFGLDPETADIDGQFIELPQGGSRTLDWYFYNQPTCDQDLEISVAQNNLNPGMTLDTSFPQTVTQGLPGILTFQVSEDGSNPVGETGNIVLEISTCGSTTNVTIGFKVT